MEVQAIAKYVRMSPKKGRDLARVIQGRSVVDALQITGFSHRKAGFYIGKTLKSAIANAENNAGLSSENLYVQEVHIEQGPSQKRWWPRARGMVSHIIKRTSHIKVTLTDKKLKKKKS